MGRSMWRLWFIVGLCAVLMVACMAKKVQSPLWSAQDVVKAGGSSVEVVSKHVTLTLPGKVIVGSVNRRLIEEILEVLANIDQIAGMHTNLYITSRAEPFPNAFSAYVQDGYIIAINMSMLHMLSLDSEMIAVLIGHEVAHNVLRHHEATGKRETALSAGEVVAGVVMVVGGPIAASLTSVAVSLIDSSLSREQETEADELGVRLMHRAGYSLAGVVPFYGKISGFSESAISFLSSHPSSQDRIDDVQRVVESLN